MQINKIRVSHPQFKSNNEHIFGFDDSISQERRDFLREQYLDERIPYYSILERSKRLEKYELEKLIASLYGQKIHQDSLQSILEVIHRKKTDTLPSQIVLPNNNALNHDMMKELPLWNLYLVSEKQGVYRGESLQGNLNFLKTVQNAGIKRIVDLAGYKNLEDECKELGLEYHHYPMTPHLFFINNPMFKTEEETKLKIFNQSRLFGYKGIVRDNYVERMFKAWQKNKDEEINKFIEFIQFMQKGNIYIGCEWGSYTTDGGLMLNSFFNPLYTDAPVYLTPDNKVHLHKVQKLYNNFTAEHKKLMGWTQEFDKNTCKKLKQLIKPC